MITERITDPSAVDSAQIERILRAGKTATVQFSRVPYSRKLLANVDALCLRFGDRLEVRFYAHDTSAFDASYLELIPNVRWLSVDCLVRATNLEHLSALQCLEKLSLGIHELNDPEILQKISTSELRELRLCETRKNNIDLEPLSRCQHLVDLMIAGHHKNFGVVSELKNLEALHLRGLSKVHSLEAVSRIRNLKTLSVILGGRTDINELAHPKLEDLAIIRVLGFSDPGDLSRFPALRKLQIEDQIRLESFDLSTAPSTLEEIAVGNCKKLREVRPLDHLKSLRSLRLVLTAVDFERFLALCRPPSLRQIVFRSCRGKIDLEYEARLAALGYS